MSMGTSLSYTSNLNASVERKAHSGCHVVVGMPYRSEYEADQGWEQLLEPKATKITAKSIKRVGRLQ